MGADTQTYVLVFGLNSHLYFGTGDVLTGLEKKENVMKAMQSLLISAHQVLEKMQLINNFEFYKSKNIRAYLKTKRDFFKELIGDCKEDKFIDLVDKMYIMKQKTEDVSQIINCCEISSF